MVPASRRIVDGFALFGGVSPSALADATNRVIALSLYHWPSRNTIPEVATTDLLRLFHGRFGKYVGIYQVARQIPKTVNTLFTHVGDVTDALGLALVQYNDIELRPELRVEHKAACLRRSPAGGAHKHEVNTLHEHIRVAL